MAKRFTAGLPKQWTLPDDIMTKLQQAAIEQSLQEVDERTQYILKHVWHMKFRGPVTSKKLRRRGVSYLIDLETGDKPIIGIKFRSKYERIEPMSAERQKEYDDWCKMSATIKQMKQLALTGI